MTGFPLRYVHQNILVGQGEARAALFRVDTVSYPFLAAADKREWLRRLARFAFAVEADFSLWRVCRAYPADQYGVQAHGLLDERHQSAVAWRQYLKGHEAHLRELRSFVPEVYLAIALAGERSSGVARMRRRVEDLFGVAGGVPIPAGGLGGVIGAGGGAFRRGGGGPPPRRAAAQGPPGALSRGAPGG